MLAANLKGFFTIPHFDGFSSVLIELRKATKKQLRDAIVDGWLACAPPRSLRVPQAIATLLLYGVRILCEASVPGLHL